MIRARSRSILRCALTGLLLLFLPAAALAGGLSCARGDAGLLGGASAQRCADRTEAMARLMRGEADACLVTVEELLEAIQGAYEDEGDPELTLVGAVAESDLYLVVSRQTASDYGLTDLASLRDRLRTEPLALCLMRGFRASHTDYAAWLLLDALPFDAALFVDDEDMRDSLGDEAYVMVTDTAGARALSASGRVVLGALTARRTDEFPRLPCAAECGLPVIAGPQWLVLSTTDAAEAVALPSPGSRTLSEAHLHAPTEDPPLDERITAYVDYILSEGLDEPFPEVVWDDEEDTP